MEFLLKTWKIELGRPPRFYGLFQKKIESEMCLNSLTAFFLSKLSQFTNASFPLVSKKIMMFKKFGGIAGKFLLGYSLHLSPFLNMQLLFGRGQQLKIGF